MNFPVPNYDQSPWVYYTGLRSDLGREPGRKETEVRIRPKKRYTILPAVTEIRGEGLTEVFILYEKSKVVYVHYGVRIESNRHNLEHG